MITMTAAGTVVWDCVLLSQCQGESRCSGFQNTLRRSVSFTYLDLYDHYDAIHEEWWEGCAVLVVGYLKTFMN